MVFQNASERERNGAILSKNRGKKGKKGRFEEQIVHFNRTNSLRLKCLFGSREVFVVRTRRINMVELRSFLFIFLSVSSFFIFFAF